MLFILTIFVSVRAAELPGAAQEQLGRELLDRIDSLAALRADIEIRLRQLEAGKRRELDIEDVIRRARAEHGSD